MRVAVTEPRRLAAVTVAERVATERGEKVGGGALVDWSFFQFLSLGGRNSGLPDQA